MEKLIEYFKNNHQGKNWTLFLIILGVVHSAWFVEFFHCVNWWLWALQVPKANFDIGTQNPYFIFLEILFIASGITRFLVAIDIFYIIANIWLCDWIMKKLWKKRRDEWRRWKVYCSLDDETFLYKESLNDRRFDTSSYYLQYWIKLEIKRLKNLSLTKQ